MVSWPYCTIFTLIFVEITNENKKKKVFFFFSKQKFNHSLMKAFPMCIDNYGVYHHQFLFHTFRPYFILCWGGAMIMFLTSGFNDIVNTLLIPHHFFFPCALQGGDERWKKHCLYRFKYIMLTHRIIDVKLDSVFSPSEMIYIDLILKIQSVKNYKYRA